MVARRNGRVFNTSVRSVGRVVSAGQATVSAARTSEGLADLKRDEDLDAELRGKLELAFGGEDDLLMPYQPTPSINPPRPRTLAAGYDKNSQSLFIRFRAGALYRYDGVTPREWAALRRVNSPGRWINRVANNKPYTRLQ